ncbi:hypothetical protein EYF80_029592 [Liparis tanakae]|uniref:Uncharacterized protein n=1 Tax=Liparis tanakae TaxID=230148 RepID=A0A4Z2H319_9TELE|nr:hypothetical protein EYF80_029592 [Liparis tanakae]
MPMITASRRPSQAPENSSIPKTQCHWGGGGEKVVETSTATPATDRSLLDFLTGEGAAVRLSAGGPLRALLHPLHHQFQEGDHRLVHVNTRHRARLKSNISRKPMASLKKAVSMPTVVVNLRLNLRSVYL